MNGLGQLTANAHIAEAAVHGDASYGQFAEKWRATRAGGKFIRASKRSMLLFLRQYG